MTKIPSSFFSFISLPLLYISTPSSLAIPHPLLCHLCLSPRTSQRPFLCHTEALPVVFSSSCAEAPSIFVPILVTLWAGGMERGKDPSWHNHGRQHYPLCLVEALLAASSIPLEVMLYPSGVHHPTPMTRRRPSSSIMQLFDPWPWDAATEGRGEVVVLSFVRRIGYQLASSVAAGYRALVPSRRSSGHGGRRLSCREGGVPRGDHGRGGPSCYGGGASSSGHGEEGQAVMEEELWAATMHAPSGSHGECSFR